MNPTSLRWDNAKAGPDSSVEPELSSQQTITRLLDTIFQASHQHTHSALTTSISHSRLEETMGLKEAKASETKHNKQQTSQQEQNDRKQLQLHNNHHPKTADDKPTRISIVGATVSSNTCIIT